MVTCSALRSKLLSLTQKVGLFALLVSCVERYEFVVKDNTSGLVIESYISDKSFFESLEFPSNGRLFQVRLSRTSDVINTRSKLVSDAGVRLISDDGQEHFYTMVSPGIYLLQDSSFSARRGIQYRLSVNLEDGEVFESAWEAMPDIDVPPVGEIDFIEGSKQVYVNEAFKWVVRQKQIAEVNISLPENTSDETIYYRWTFQPMWEYKAPLSSVSSPGHRCWITSPWYLNNYVVQADQSGGYTKYLFDLETVRNSRIYEKFSVLVDQFAMTESYFNFWSEMKDKTESSSIKEIPPFNLNTNFKSVNGHTPVFGYFGVVAEQATRWYFEKEQLSYQVEDTLLKDCLSIEDLAPECVNCMAYSFGDATNERPSWWAD